MVSAIAAQKLKSQLKVTQYLSGDASTAKAIAFVDMLGYGAILIGVLAAALTGAGVTAFKIVASTVSAGTNPVDVVAHAVGSAPDAAGDYLWLEVTEEQLKEVGTDLRYVSAVVDAAHASDNIAVTYIRGLAKNQGADLTADHVAA